DENPRLVVLSVDGLRADLVWRPDYFKLKIPALRKLIKAGTSAEGMQSVFPSTTYPAHTTLVTGVPPRVHGIYSHLDSRDPSATARPWHWFARAIKVPTLWDAAREAGLTTASIGWPVSAGAAIDYNIPEIWDPAAADLYKSFETAAENSTPGLFDEVRNDLQTLPPDATHDRLRTEAALYLWRQYHPDLLLIHLVVYDEMAHHLGPFSPQALAALEQTDMEIARIREAVGGRVTCVVLSDHGFVSVEKEVAPQVALENEGLFGRNSFGKLQLKKLGTIHAGGSFAIYWLKAPTLQDRRALACAVGRICETGAVAEVVDRKKLRALGADPDAELILDAAQGYYFSDRNNGPLVRDSVDDRGAHGHLPSQAGLDACFIAVGPGIRKGQTLGQISLTQVAPTLARVLRLPADALVTKAEALDLT
ncbi:MAG TPA: ectonucleotide pyrophosphatase/phosphodiesterase, partial [Terriglobia bacterium]|nr:ectonucleotide pyrophosphatase/phosphodiesterase [Terriglobia bacterium]